MANKPLTFDYDYETITKLSGWTPEHLRQSVARDGVKIASLADVAIWLAANGRPKIRAEMARQLLPAVFGIELRRPSANRKLAGQVNSIDLLLQVFERADQLRHARGKKISKSKGQSPSS